MWNLYSLLSRPTAILGLRLWVVIAVSVATTLLLLFLFLLPLCRLVSRPRRGLRRHHHHHQHSKTLKLHLQDPNPPVSKEIVEISHRVHIPTDAEVLSNDDHHYPPPPPPASASASASGTTASGESRAAPPTSAADGKTTMPAVSELGWGQRFSLKEVEAATGGLTDENVVGEGGYGIVYRGVLPDNTIVAIKNLLNNRGQAEKEFRVEVEAIGRVRHKNLVKLLGYCIEESHRMLVYEFIDNGNLDQWLHGDVGEASPLTWDIRMNIILGIAKGLAYLHEGLEPKVVHRDVKSGNILLDQRWNPKVSDFGLAKLLHSEKSYLTTRVMGTFGYVSPEYASTGMLNERSDVYSFGVLIMEIISGRAPVDYARPKGEVSLVEWLKVMLGERKFEGVVDPKMPEEPSAKALKRALLVAIRCVDPDADKRPGMGHVVHMLEIDDLLLRGNCSRLGREGCSRSPDVGLSQHDHQTKLRWGTQTVDS